MFSVSHQESKHAKWTLFHKAEKKWKFKKTSPYIYNLMWPIPFIPEWDITLNHVPHLLVSHHYEGAPSVHCVMRMSQFQHREYENIAVPCSFRTHCVTVEWYGWLLPDLPKLHSPSKCVSPAPHSPVLLQDLVHSACWQLSYCWEYLESSGHASGKQSGCPC